MRLLLDTKLNFNCFAILMMGCVAFSSCDKTDKTAPAKEKPETSVNTLLLKDYKPESMYNSHGPSVEKAAYPIIDMHAHPYAKSEQQLDEWIQTMDKIGIDKTVILTYATGDTFDSLVQAYGKYEDRFILFCGFDYTGYDKADFGPAAVKELERCFAAGAKGVGELGDKGKGLFYSRPTKAFGMHIDDPRMKPLIRKCGELGMPISIHVAEPIWMYRPMDASNDGLMNAFKWRLDDQEGIVDHGGMINILENAVEENPETTFIACHYANSSYDLSILGRLFERYPNLYADNSARYAETASIPRTVSKFYTRYADRLVYGTDMGTSEDMYKTTLRILETADEHFYDRNISSYHWAMHGFDLSAEVLEKVYRENAVKILKLQP
ncbi:Predicted metal-dependent hydrolase, TIM-barrel fold [Cyclobacterium lianum]|uniref:Predicted metal-dependent hydrolase, TIM-barrel fold n=1 Tax=Cyclobacterium lianum TaxID=388280 RepID=A0A1M7L8R0_9BACT|nr:amidohydrolase family protein [Cyclobacterium lianum]SHM74142.1 Predicted metal-dependent hydrolase, TIM-barrel fold [Cyclobacterium lianum]